MFKVYSSQFNYLWGDQIHFPYSIATLIANIKSKKNLEPNFKFENTYIFRDKVNDYVKQCKDADVLLCSCYVWNWEITTYLAREIKKINPKCITIFGGPQVPDRTDGFFEKYPFIDIIVHGEGEEVIANIFEAYLKDRDFSNVKGIETKEFKTERQQRIKDLNAIPSPYLTNLIWDLTEKVEGINYLASWETNRGCPYPCTFCDWGSLTNQKIFAWSEDKLFKEIEWFSENKIVYVDSCDANFGIYQEKDFRLSKKLKEVALKTGFPQRVRFSWAKFSSEKIIPIAKELQKADLLRAVTLALQSLDETTLEIVKRANIKFKKFSELTEAFRKNQIPTYTELIMGMPGETVESWKKGLEILASDTKIDSIYIYNCTVLPNAPMNEPAYRDFYKIKTVRSPIYLPHSSTHNVKNIQEYEYITISTSSFSLADLKKMFFHSWLIQTFHSLGLLEHISKYYNKIHGLKYMEFYDALLEFCQTKKSNFSKEYETVVNYVNNGYSGKGWDHSDPKIGDLYWAIEEASWLRFSYDKKTLSENCEMFLTFLEEKYQYHTPFNILKDLIKFQIFLLTTREDYEETKSDNFEFNWKDFLVNGSNLIQEKKNYYYKNLVTEKDAHQWAYKTIWFGRYQSKYKFHPEFLQETKEEIKIPQNVRS